MSSALAVAPVATTSFSPTYSGSSLPTLESLGMGDVEIPDNIAALDAWSAQDEIKRNPIANANGISPELMQLWLILLALMQSAAGNDSGGDSGGIIDALAAGSGGSGGYAPASSSGYSVQPASYASYGQGDLKVGPLGARNPAGVAQGLLGHSAQSIMDGQQVPMNRGVNPRECCANFASACLVKAGYLSPSDHTDRVSDLRSTLLQKGWHVVSRNEATPGAVCIKGGDQHVELVAKNENGTVTLIGSNNQGGSGPQVVSYDGSTGNKGDVEFLVPPGATA
jgi:hypothetical protein